jgi:hypothetical protein
VSAPPQRLDIALGSISDISTTSEKRSILSPFADKCLEVRLSAGASYCLRVEKPEIWASQIRDLMLMEIIRDNGINGGAVR